MPMFWDRNPLFVDAVPFLHLLSLCYTSPHLCLFECCFFEFLELLFWVSGVCLSLCKCSITGRAGYRSNLESVCFSTCVQRGYSSLMLPNNIISKAPFTWLIRQVTKDCVYLFEQYQIATICSSYLVSLFQSHFVGTGFNSARMQEDGDLISCLKKIKITKNVKVS